MRVAFLTQLSYPLQALAATIFTWGITALGAATVFLIGRVRTWLLDAMLGFSGGVMLAASYFSLLGPAVTLAETLGMRAWVVVMAGFGFGGMVFCIIDAVLSRLWRTRGADATAAQKTRKRRAMLMLSITLHNIPEGMAIGVAFGSLAYGIEGCTLASAGLLALGIGLQNFPEGSAVSLPLLREGMSRGKAFFYGQLSAMVEPVFGFLGALLVLRMRTLLPFLLSFAAGAMVFVVVDELLPESRQSSMTGISTICVMVGFLLMMALDVALG